MTSTTPTDIVGASVPVQVPSSPLNFIGLVQTSPIRLMTLVGPRQIVGATHYQNENPLPDKCQVVFMVDVNTPFTATILGSHTVDDVQVFALDRDVPIKPVPIAPLAMITPMVTYFAAGIRDVYNAAEAIVGPANFQFISGNFARFAQTPTCTVENGDSGAPTLIKANGSYSLVGPHYSNRPGSYFLDSILARYPALFPSN